MAEEEPQAPASIQDRIAALKLAQVGRVPQQSPSPSHDQAGRGAVGRPRPPPPPTPVRPAVPPRPNVGGRAVSSNNPPIRDHVTVAGRIGNLPEEGLPNGNGMDGISRPALPPRTSTQSISQGPNLPPRRPSEQSPSLPPRRPSEVPSTGKRLSGIGLNRRESNDSISSIATARSSVSAVSNGTSVTSKSDRYSIRAPDFDPSSLPALPPKRTQEEKDAAARKDSARRPYQKTYSSPNVQPKSETPPQMPARPQNRPALPLPARSTTQDDQLSSNPVPASRVIAPPPRKSALSMGFGNTAQQPLPPPGPRPGSVPATNGHPPPIPTGTRPNLEALKASKPKLNGSSPSASVGGPGSCLLCRDFSAPDNHAARFSRQSMPSLDVDWLANQLTSPFPSLTDKARSIFTWLHHNVAYDVVAFFGNNVKGSTPQSTLASGVAVCEGYAGLFAALALKAGLEAVVIGGASKGFGYNKLRPGEAIPPFKSTHAWNAVRLDDGNWKLIDSCWGAGTVEGRDQSYTKRFAAERFTQPNDEFALDHFPEDSSKQFRNDGRVLTWEEFSTDSKSGTAAMVFGGYVTEEGLSKPTLKPSANPIVLSQQGPTVRFSFQKICPHWDPVRCGKGPYYLYLLAVEGANGKSDKIPFQQGDGVWWCDVRLADLGRPGQKVSIVAVTKFADRDPRGLTAQDFMRGKGRVGMSYAGVATWDIV